MYKNADNSRLYVANAHSDTISVVDTASLQVISTVLLPPQIARDLAGATASRMAVIFTTADRCMPRWAI